MKASDLLAEQLRERILRGEFALDAQLPSERSLVEQSGMSRTTVREALRILEVEGFVRIRTGRTGGAFVGRPGEESVTRSVGMLVRGGRVWMSALLETREGVEPACARLAALHRSDADLERLEAADVSLASAESRDAFLRANIDWHVAVAAATGNELLSAFTQALSWTVYEATDNQRFVDAAVRDTTARAHRSITRAIRERDEEAAFRRMGRHLHGYAKAIAEVEPRTDIAIA